MNAAANLPWVNTDLPPAMSMEGQEKAEIRARLRYKKPRADCRCYQLPFIGKGDEYEWDFWSVPLIGSHHASDAGIYFAQMLMRYLRESELEFFDKKLLLSKIVCSMLSKARTASDDEFDSLECQVSGFMRQILACVICASKGDAMRNLDGLDPKVLLREANFALNGKPYANKKKGDANGPEPH